jgi:hypothetical protein
MAHRCLAEGAAAVPYGGQEILVADPAKALAVWSEEGTEQV